MSKLEKWADFLPPEELATYAKGKFGERVGFGRKPALLNIDTTYMVVDPAFPQCGEGDPELVENITKSFWLASSNWVTDIFFFTISSSFNLCLRKCFHFGKGQKIGLPASTTYFHLVTRTK